MLSARRTFLRWGSLSAACAFHKFVEDQSRQPILIVAHDAAFLQQIAITRSAIPSRAILSQRSRTGSAPLAHSVAAAARGIGVRFTTAQSNNLGACGCKWRAHGRPQ